MSPGGEEEKLAKKRNCQKQEEKRSERRRNDHRIWKHGVGGDHDKHCFSGQEGMKA